MKMTSKSDGQRIIVGEKALAWNEKMLYDVNVLDRRKGDDGWEYHVHYCGWNKKWDEWMTQSSMLPYTAANLDTRDDLKEKKKKKALEAKRKSNLKRKAE